jgi:membrane-associated phospholipid phosphatase
MKTPIFVLTLFSIIQINVFSESVFTLETKKDIVIGAFSLGIGIAPFLIKNEPENIRDNLNKNDINPFDKPLLFSYNKPLDMVSDYGVYGLLLLPALSVLPRVTETNTLLTYSVMYAETLLLAYGTTYSLKNAVIRYRPYMYTAGIPDGKEDDYHNSFPSGSTTWAFLGAAFLTAAFYHEFPESKWKLPILIGSYTAATGIAAMRIVSGSHFLTDVLTGSVIGSLYGWLIPALHLKKDHDKVSFLPTGNGITVFLKF